MKLKDIVNRDNVNITNCDQEPIHIPGSIQPHGCLLAIDISSFEIRFCSANTKEILGISHEQLLNKLIFDFANPATKLQLESSIGLAASRVIIIELLFSGNPVGFIGHISGSHLVLEAERKDERAQRPDMLELSKEFVSYIEETSTLKELAQRVAEGTRKITGYDRVMIYRFDEQYNGEVIAESKEEHLESFYGLHYPHTDIPVQARELYIRNQLRIIVDVTYEPVPIFTMDAGANNQTLDLSISLLRSVSPIHVQYLHNMGVGATLTISLLHKQKLWGLVTCHHYSPKHLDYESRMAAKLLGHFITSQIDTRLLNEEYEVAKKVSRAIDQLSSEKPALTRDSFLSIAADPNLLDICNAGGVSIVVNGVVYKGGLTPTDAEVRQLASSLAMHYKHSAFSTHSIKALLPELTFLSGHFPGVHYIPLDATSLNCIIWYRQETIHEVNWAGDPAKSIEKDQNGLSPRKSFDLWKQTVKHQSKPWLKSELEASAVFANILEKHIGAVLLAEEEEKQRKLARALTQTNAELENINWISTHDLQEPLRKIQLMASMLMSDKKQAFEPATIEKIGKMNQFAARMQTLIKDILKYTRLNYSSEALEMINLGSLVEDVKQEVADLLEEKKATLSTGELPVVKGVPFLLRQLIANLVYNSLKFKSETLDPEISIQLSGELPPVLPQGMTLSPDTYHTIIYHDNGIGFHPSFNESVFKIFTRLHTVDQYSGSGIGLALCKKIMTSHEGFITAEGKVNEGVTFRLYFPKV